ncbi:MAG: cell shape determination protein CcmA [Gammaproteobacteria bacterium]|nr:MAG: cell shape determination protein CcmA [Gammaproteobacteria bacterium]
MLGKNKTNVDKIGTLISAEVELQGDLYFKGGVQIEGRVIGNIIAEEGVAAKLCITEEGYVEGEIRVPKVIINGQVKGDVYSNDHVELAAKARVTGNVHYNLIEMVMGAEVNGNLMHNGDQQVDLGKGASTKKDDSNLDVDYSAAEPG